MRKRVGKPISRKSSKRKVGARTQPKTALKAAKVNLKPDLQRIIRKQAVGNWQSSNLSALTPQYIESILRGALGGNHVQQYELFDLMEDTWPRLAKNLGEIKDAVQGMDWKLEAWAEEAMPPSDAAMERKQLISAGVWEMNPAPDRDDSGFEQTVADILDAWGKGVSVSEVIWEQRRVGKLGEMTVPNCTAWVHPINYAWSDDGYLGLSLSRDVTPSVFRSRVTSDVVPFPEHCFLIGINKAKSGHPLLAARLRPLAWWWCAANFSGDWLMNLAQLFGLPFRWATYSDNADIDTIDLINDLLENMGSSGRAAFPEGTNLNFLEGGKTAGSSPQDGLLDRADKACDLLILRQTLTSDAPAEGGTQALGRVHKTVRDQVIQSAANFVARVLNQQLIPAILLQNYDDADEAPYFCPEFETSKDLKATAELIKGAVDAGLKVPKKWAHAELNIPLPQAGEEVLERAQAAPLAIDPYAKPTPPGAPGKPAGAEKDLENDAEDVAELEARNALRAAAALTPEEKVAISISQKADPIVALLARIANIKDDAEMMATLKQFYAEAPMLTALVTADLTRQQLALEAFNAAALKKGLAGK